jgi:hypothetical protein
VSDIYYNIHGRLGIKISPLSWHLIRDLNCQYSYFAIQEDLDPDIFVEIGNFVPDISNCFSLDHKYFIKKDFIFLEDQDKKLRWKLQIEGLETNKVKVKFFTTKTVYIKFPWMFFPDLILHLYALQPLLEVMLFRKGLPVVHTAAVHRNGKAYLMAGRGGAHKTNFVLELMRRGYDYISDDMVILHGKEVLSFPHSISLFDFIRRYLGREEMNLWEKMRLFWFLRRPPRLGFNVINHSKLGGLTFLIPTNKPNIQVLKDIDLRGLLRMLLFNQMMERTSYVSHKTIIGKFFDAYRFIFPESKFFPDREEWEDLLMMSFEGIPFRVLEVPIEWQSHFTDKLLIE